MHVQDSELIVKRREDNVQTEVCLKHVRRVTLKPMALFSLTGHVILSVKPIPHTAGVRLPTCRLCYSSLTHPLKVASSRSTRLSISSENDLFIIPWRSENTFSSCLNTFGYAFPLLSEDFSGFGVFFFESFLEVTSHRRQLWFTITVIIGVGWHSSGNSFD